MLGLALPSSKSDNLAVGPMDDESIALGRTAFEQRKWTAAYTRLAAADKASPLEPHDLDRLGTAAYLVGEDTASVDARSRAYHGFLERGEPVRAARSAFWLIFTIWGKPDFQAQATGWQARVRRLLNECSEECAEHGLLLCGSAFQRVRAGDFEAAYSEFKEAARIGARFKDPDLTALARHGEGRSLVMMNRTGDGFAMLDEVMVAVTSGEVGPMIAGVVYCSVISACHDQFDLRRAQEWTTALAGWCATQPDLVPFRGSCLIHRSELLQMHGEWQDAIGEVQRACERLAIRGNESDIGAAYYQQAELYRLRGEFEKAEEAYRLASRAGRKPDPGLALLRLAQGQHEAAVVAIRRVLQEVQTVRMRAQALGASVEIMLANHDVAAARSAAEELNVIAGKLDAPFLRAASAQALGAVALVAGNVDESIGSLREALTEWQGLDAPYPLAQVRALIGLAYRKLGDEDGARLEFDAAQEVFERLGAAPDAARMTALLTPATRPLSGGLTGREVEVLRLVAAGKTNRTIAGELAISEKTVARHVSNIFTKLDLSSRSGATAYAYEHKLL
jgi:DNA-binding CsgD family transcriptional regulator